MVKDPFPDYGPDGEEPEGSGPLPGEGDGLGPGGDEIPPDGTAQGLYVCLPAEELTLAGFAQDGTADTMAPGPLLAMVVHAITGEDGAGLKGLSDDQLIGIISAARRMESRAAWTLMAAMGEFARRRPDHDTSDHDTPAQDIPGGDRTGLGEFVGDELAGTLHLTWQSAADQVAYACTVAGRLPATFAALAAGLIHPVHVRIIEDETQILSDADAARADEKLAEMARSKTFGQLRYAAHRLVLRMDPDSALRRKAESRKDAHVRRFREDSGNAGMIARELPPDEVLASWQHVEQRALDLRAAGMPGTLRELRVRAYLDLLQETDCRQPDASGTAGPDGTSGSEGPGDNGGSPDGPGGPDRGPGPSGPGPSGPGPDGPGPDGPGPRGSGPAGSASDGGTRPARQDNGPSLAALVNITVPLAALTGETGPPGEAAGFGLLDPQSLRELVTAASRNPNTRWCLTALHPNGTAAAHGCAAGPHPLILDPRHDRDSPGEPPGSLRPDQAAEFLRALKLRLNAVIRGPCNHAQAQASYRPSRTLRHLISARNTRCTAPGCGQPAARCDLDHTSPWHHGGPTCPCNLAPLCRHHHRCKQAEGWWLEQPEPGVLIWHTPAGRTYTTTPTEYPV